MQDGGNQFLAPNEVVSSTADRNQMSQPESSSLCALISSAAYPASGSCMLQPCNDVAASELTNAPSVVNQVDVTNRFSKQVVMPLPTIQAVAGVQLPASQSGPVLPDSGSASTVRGWCPSLVCAVVDDIIIRPHCSTTYQGCRLGLNVSVSRQSRDVVSKCLRLVSVSWKRGKISISSRTENQMSRSRLGLVP